MDSELLISVVDRANRLKEPDSAIITHSTEHIEKYQEANLLDKFSYMKQLIGDNARLLVCTLDRSLEVNKQIRQCILCQETADWFIILRNSRGEMELFGPYDSEESAFDGIQQTIGSINNDSRMPITIYELPGIPNNELTLLQYTEWVHKVKEGLVQYVDEP